VSKLDEMEIFSLTQDAVVLAVMRDGDGAAAALQQLGKGTDRQGMFGVATAFAEVGKQALIRANGGAPLDEPLTAGQQHNDPAEDFALRFIIAYANGADVETRWALFLTTYSTGGAAHVDAMVALLITVAGMWNDATQGVS
jgi:hypothetical protein